MVRAAGPLPYDVYQQSARPGAAGRAAPNGHVTLPDAPRLGFTPKADLLDMAVE